MQINCPDGTLLESRELFWRIILNQYICILLHLAHYFIHPTCLEPWSEEFRYFFFLKILWYRQTFCIMYYTNRSNFCPLLISIFALFASDNLFVGDKELIFFTSEIVFSAPKNELSDVNKTCMDISNGQKFELLVIVWPPFYSFSFHF